MTFGQSYDGQLSDGCITKILKKHGLLEKTFAFGDMVKNLLLSYGSSF